MMKFTLLTVVTLWTSCASSLPGNFGEASPLERRDRRRSSSAHGPAVDAIESASKSIYYTGNWGGAVQPSKDVTSVSANVIVPKVSIPQGGDANNTYGVSVWVGIDGWNTCNTAIAQTGIEAWIIDGEVFYDAWYQWCPGPEMGYSNNLVINAGDSLTMTVHAPTNRTGNATVINHTTGKKAFTEFGKQDTPICQLNAEWIVEDFSAIQGMLPLANYSSVTITNATYIAGGELKDAADAQPLGIKTLQGHHTDTECSVNGSSITCKYVEP